MEAKTLPNEHIFATKAPEAYDGFSTQQIGTVKVVALGELRIVSVLEKDMLWQTGRYASGMYGAFLLGDLQERFTVTDLKVGRRFDSHIGAEATHDELTERGYDLMLPEHESFNDWASVLHEPVFDAEGFYLSKNREEIWQKSGEAAKRIF